MLELPDDCVTQQNHADCRTQRKLFTLESLDVKKLRKCAHFFPLRDFFVGFVDDERFDLISLLSCHVYNLIAT